MELGESLFLPGGDVERFCLEITREDLNSVKHETMSSYRMIDDFLRDYKSLDCSCCAHHFGYQHRKYPSIQICSSRCLAVVDQKLKAQASKMGDYSIQLLELYEIMNNGRVKVDGSGSGSGPKLGPAKVGSMSGNFGYGGSREPYLVNGINENSCHGRTPSPPEYTRESVNKSKGWQQYYDRKSEKLWLEHEKKKIEALLMEFESEEPDSVPDVVPTLVEERTDDNAGTSSSSLAATEPVPTPEPKPDEPSPVAVLVSVPVGAPLLLNLDTKPAKRIWTINNLITSLELVNQAPCHISHAWEINHFTINASADTSKLKDLDLEIQKYSDGAPSLRRVPAVNDIVFAPRSYKNEIIMARGRVTKLSEANGEMEVVYIDLGGEASVKAEDCRDPCDKIMEKHPIYGMLFTLNLTVTPPKKQLQLDGKILKIVKEATLYLQTDINSGAENQWSGTLFLDEEGTKTLNYVIEEFIAGNCQLADTTAEDKASKCIGIADSGEIKAKVDSTTPPSVSVTDPAPAPAVRQSVKPLSAPQEQSCQIQRTIHNSKFTPNLYNGAMVQIQYAWNDAMIFISSVDDEAEMDKLCLLIARHAQTAPGMARKPDVDEIVIAPYSGDYYRGRVTAVNEENVRVIFVDYGDDTEVNYKNLKELTAEIADHPIYGVVFHMAGVPDTKAFTKNNAALFEALMKTGGQIELMETDKKVVGELTGTLWLGEDDDRNWNQIALEIQEATANIN